MKIPLYLCSEFKTGFIMRKLLDKIFRVSIQVCMLTGVAFTFASCYGPGPDPTWRNTPDFQKDQQKLEQQLTVEQDSEETL